MVEGHAVQRLATTHRAVLLHRMFRADSPNGRFSAGAAAIDGRVLVRVEAIGKNLFHFYARRGVAGPSTRLPPDDDLVVVHLHFGMSGQFRTAGGPGGRPPPDARPTTRLRLVEAAPDGAPLPGGLVGLVSVSVATAGGPKLFTDALTRPRPRPAARRCSGGSLPDRLAATDRSVGAVLMDQTAIAGVGNIFRSEVCHKARVHPDEPGRGSRRRPPPPSGRTRWICCSAATSTARL
ncbi:hypothetical protein MMPV_010078 [Pyropia vietnamensis]